MKKIAIVLPELLPVPPVEGGAVEHWVHEATKRYDKEDVEITVISRPAGVEGLKGVKYAGIEWSHLSRFFHRLKNSSARKNPLRALSKVQNVWSYGRKITDILKGFDVICIQNEPNLLLFVDKMPNQKIILHMHNEHLAIRHLKFIYKHLLKKVDKVLCVSEYIKEKSIREFPEFRDKFSVLMNAADTDSFKPRTSIDHCILKNVPSKNFEELFIVYVGRLTQEKGVHILIEAFGEVIKSHANVKMVVAGSSFFSGAARTPYQDKLGELSAKFADKIIFTGYLKHEYIQYLYNIADVVVVPSIWNDPCPLVVLESMSSGCATVATKVGGIPEMIINDQVGILVPPNDSISLAQSLIELIENPEKRCSIGLSASELVQKNYNWNQLSKKFKIALEL
ncbi:glycosyltransferase family 4 protein [Asticcacaulis sp.]|uniref:glycosyltransferase family 4 protein n=1 Tax=Asticcacaulis sp. TaxID=1872648 RepID=UPI0031D260EF